LETARDSIVLLKNNDNLLPLNRNKHKSIAVLGPNASNIVSGDNSGKPVIKPVSVLDGIKAQAGANVAIKHVEWKSTSREFVLIEPQFLSKDTSVEEGLYAEYYDTMNLKGTPKNRIDKMVNYDAVSQPPDPVISDAPMSIRWTGYITRRVSGSNRIRITSSDGIRFWVENKLEIDKWRDRAETSDQIEYQMDAGRKYAVKLEYCSILHPSITWRSILRSTRRTSFKRRNHFSPPVPLSPTACEQ
jgi:beta-glucosidase